MSIKTYDVGFHGLMLEGDNGKYVLTSDYAAAVAARDNWERLAREREALCASAEVALAEALTRLYRLRDRLTVVGVKDGDSRTLYLLPVRKAVAGVDDIHIEVQL